MLTHIFFSSGSICPVRSCRSVVKPSSLQAVWWSRLVSCSLENVPNVSWRNRWPCHFVLHLSAPGVHQRAVRIRKVVATSHRRNERKLWAAWTHLKIDLYYKNPINLVLLSLSLHCRNSYYTSIYIKWGYYGRHKKAMVGLLRSKIEMSKHKLQFNGMTWMSSKSFLSWLFSNVITHRYLEYRGVNVVT